MNSKVLILSIVCYCYCAYARTGEEIADALYQHGTECKDPSDGGLWAPLQGENPDCGGKQCTYPQQWCSATSKPNEQTPTLNCVDLPPDCQKVLQDTDTTTPAAVTDTTAAPAAETTTQVTTTSATVTQASQASTAASKAAATPGAGGVTAAPSGSTPAGGCKDTHEYCCFWASRQQCNANPKWMRTNCQQSCGTCGCQEAQFQKCQVKVSMAPCKWNRVRVMLGGGPGLAAMGFGNPGGNGSSSVVSVPVGGGGSMPGFGPPGFGTAGGQQSNKVRIPLGGGPSPLMMFGFGNSNNGTSSSGSSSTGAGAPGSSPSGGSTDGTGSSSSGGQPSSVVTIPVGRKRRHFMPRWYNN